MNRERVRDFALGLGVIWAAGANGRSRISPVIVPAFGNGHNAQPQRNTGRHLAKDLKDRYRGASDPGLDASSDVI
jgi:hypothetical protein